MDAQKIQSIQNKMIALQENILETATDAGQQISISINGKMQIANLSIDKQLSAQEIELKLPKVLNEVILKTSTKVQEALRTAMGS